MNPAKFDPSVPTLFLASSTKMRLDGADADALARGDKVLAEIATLVGQASNLKEKRESLTKHLSEHDDQGGVMSKLDLDMGEEAKNVSIFEGATLWEERGSAPWLVCWRPWRWRFSPPGWPLLGMGALVKPLPSAGVYFLFLIAPVAEVLKAGIALPDLSSHLLTESGLSYTASFLKVVRVEDGATLWVPYGWVCIPLAYDNIDKKSTAGVQGGTGAGAQGVATAIVINPTFVGMASALPTSVWTSLQTYNTDHLDRVAEKKAWAARAQYFQKISGQVSGASPS